MSVTASPPRVNTSPPQAEPSPAVEIEIDSGVIEEARRRQRRRRAVGSVLGAGAVAIVVAAALIGGKGNGGSGGSGAAGDPAAVSPLKLTLVHGRALIGGQPALMGVTPSLQAGNVGVCVKFVNTGSCNGPLPTATQPLYGGERLSSSEKVVGTEGEVDVMFTGPGVAALRVAHLGTFKAQSAAGLPPGAKQVVFYRPPGARGTLLPPWLPAGTLQRLERSEQNLALTETLLDGSGQAIRVDAAPTFTLPNSYWRGDQQPPRRGRCAISSTLPGVRTQWGQVATVIAPDRAITVPGWLTCLHTWFSLHGVNFETAVLLNAKAPGRPPAMLWGAIPVAGHPGIVQIPAMQQQIHFRLAQLSPRQEALALAEAARKPPRARAMQEQRLRERLAGREHSFWDVLTPPTLARRVGPTWVLVRDGGSLGQRIEFLQALHVTKLKL